MSWPAAHRSGSAKYQNAPQGGSFQKPPPRPANDNVRIPTPANDNTRSFPKPPSPPKTQFGRRIPPAVKAIAARSLPAARLLRIVPWVGWGLAAYEAFQYIRPRVPYSMGGFNKAAYTLTNTCQAGGVPQGRQIFNCNPVQAPFTAAGNRPPTLYTWHLHPEQPYITPGWFLQEPGQTWTLLSGNPGRQVWPRQSLDPRPNPVPWPALDPFIFPPLSPMPEPVPLPRNAVPRLRPRPEEGNHSDVGPTTRNQPRPQQRHRPQRPGERTQERKGKVRQGFVVALKTGYAATEANDFIEALFDGVSIPGMKKLPPAFKNTPEGLNSLEKAQWMFKHWQEIDMTQALLNLAANQVIDLAVGTIGGRADKFATDLGITYHNQLLSGGIKV